MHRSASYSSARSSDEFLVNFSPAALKGFDSNQDLLTNDVISDDVSKKDISLKPSPGEKAVHLIPLVLIVCALVLWWFSNPVQLQ
ncbi:hypothetical protein Pfo_011048 [Paulownia fortunei]|nr:hypothetical protein Pfo_011048 [Paulownia fortunei]